MAPRAEDLLNVIPHALVVTSGVGHVVELVSPLGRRLLGEGVVVGCPLLEAALPGAAELVAAAESAYRLGRTTVVAVGCVVAGTSGGRGCERLAVSCEPLPGEGGARAGVLLREVPEREEATVAEVGTAGRRAREFQRLTEQLSRAATPADIGRLTATSAAAA